MAALLVGVAIYCGWTGAAWCLEGSIRHADNPESFWAFIVLYLGSGFVCAIIGLSARSSDGLVLAGVLVAVALPCALTGRIPTRNSIVRIEEDEGGFWAYIAMILVIAVVAALIGFNR